MEKNQVDEEWAGPRYARFEDIDPSHIFRSLSTLTLFGNDMYLRVQAFNLGLVDSFLTELEYNVLGELFKTERTPPESHFLSAQSQMWIFAAYELLRTWRQRCKEIIKWADNGGLTKKLQALESKKESYLHFGREARVRQIKVVIENPNLVSKIKGELLHLHVPYTRLEYIRVAMAKHEVSGQKGSASLMPTYGRINSWCGSLDFELENGKYSMGHISRRDIADSIRALDVEVVPPSEEDLKLFDEYMRGDHFDNSAVFDPPAADSIE